MNTSALCPLRAFHRLARFLAALFAAAAPASAAIYTWEGASSNLWTVAANWSTGLPATLNDDEVVFPPDGANKAMNNNYASVLRVHRLTFSGSGYSLSGTELNFGSALGIPELRVTHTSGTTSLNSPLSLNEPAIFSTVAGGTLSSSFLATVALGSSTLTLDSDGSMSLLGEISGNGGVTLTGAGLVTYGGTHSYSGGTALNAGRLNISTGANVSASTITVAAGAVLSGTGSLTALTSSGTVSPGNTAIGRLTAAGSVTFSNTANSILALDLGTDVTPASTYDQLTCQGAVSIGASSVLQLTPTGTFAPVVGDAYTLINKSGTTAISGAFSGIPNNGYRDIGTRRLQFSYTGGTGNDLVATMVNTLPSFTKGANQNVNEDAGARSIPGWAAGITDNDAGVAQVLKFNVTNDNNSLFATQPDVNATGTLTFDPAPNAHGSATVSVSLTDDAGAAGPDGADMTTAIQTFTITVTPVNDAPVVLASSLNTIEDLASAITLNGTDPDGDALTYVIVGGPSHGTLTGSGANRTYTPAPNYHGTDSFTYKLSDGTLESATTVYAITVNPFNDMPSFTKGPNQAVNEDIGPVTVPNWATGVSDGDDGFVQALTFAVTNTNNALFSVQPAVAADGTLTFTPAANASGTASVSLSLTDDATAGGAALTTAVQSFTITVNPVNDLPSFSAGPNQTVSEDSGAASVTNWATGISDSDAAVTQILSFTVTNDNPSLFSAQPAVSSVGRLTFTPAANANGAATVTVTLTDDANAGGPALTTAQQTFTITVTPVNDMPSFAAGPNQVHGTNPGAITIPNWAAAISDGDPEVVQSLSFSTTNSNSAFFSVPPAVSSGGTLTYTVAPEIFGEVNVTVILTDDATAGGPALFTSRTFTIEVLETPTLDPIAPVSILEDSGPVEIPLTGIGPGSNGVLPLSITTASSFFSLLPTPLITYTSPNATGSLTLHPQPNASGSTTVLVWVDDAIPLTSANERRFTVTVVPVNDTPVLFGSPPLNLPSSAGPQTLPGWVIGSAGPANEATQTLMLSLISNSAPSLFTVGPELLADGTLTFTPVPGASGTAQLGVRLQDSGGTADGGVDTVEHIYTIHLSPSPAPIPVPSINAGGSGTASIEWHFDDLGTNPILWIDNVTVPGWYAQKNNGNTPAGPFAPSDGTISLDGLMNCGAPASADRALGSRCTSIGANGNIAYAVTVQNAGTSPVRLSRLRYAVELWRSGSIDGGEEKVTVFYSVSSTPLASIASGAPNVTAIPGAGFSDLPAAASTQITGSPADTALDGNLPAHRSIVDFIPATGDMPLIPPGHFLTLKWTDPNELHLDGHQALDDVRLEFVDVSCAIFATATLRRIPSSVAPDGSADTFEATLMAEGEGTLSPAGWHIVGGRHDGVTGAYGVPFTLAYPLADFASSPVPLTVRDAADPACTSTISLLPTPLVLGLNGLTGSTTYLQAPVAPAIFRQSALRSDPAAALSSEITMDPGSGVLLTDPVPVTPGAEKCLTLTVIAQDTSTGSGFEPDDTLKVELLTFGPQNEIETLTHDFDLNGNGFINGSLTPGEDEFNTGQQDSAVRWTSTFRLAGTIPASATSFQLRITGSIDNFLPSTEIYRFRDLSVQPCVDTDGDGVSDAWEWAHGTDPQSAASFFDISSISSDAANFSVVLPTVQGFDYQPLSSSNLDTWSRDGLPVSGDGTLKTISGPATGTRSFRRYLVIPAQTIQQ